MGKENITCNCFYRPMRLFIWFKIKKIFQTRCLLFSGSICSKPYHSGSQLHSSCPYFTGSALMFILCCLHLTVHSCVQSLSHTWLHPCQKHCRLASHMGQSSGRFILANFVSISPMYSSYPSTPYPKGTASLWFLFWSCPHQMDVHLPSTRPPAHPRHVPLAHLLIQNMP